MCSVTNEVEHNQWNDASHHTGSHKVVTSNSELAVNTEVDTTACQNDLWFIGPLYSE